MCVHFLFWYVPILLVTRSVNLTTDTASPFLFRPPLPLSDREKMFFLVPVLFYHHLRVNMC